MTSNTKLARTKKQYFSCIYNNFMRNSVEEAPERPACTEDRMAPQTYDDILPITLPSGRSSGSFVMWVVWPCLMAALRNCLSSASSAATASSGIGATCRRTQSAHVGRRLSDRCAMHRSRWRKSMPHAGQMELRKCRRTCNRSPCFARAWLSKAF